MLTLKTPYFKRLRNLEKIYNQTGSDYRFYCERCGKEFRQGGCISLSLSNFCKFCWRWHENDCVRLARLNHDYHFKRSPLS